MSSLSLSCVRFFVTPWTAAVQASLSITNSRSSLRLTSIKSAMPFSHLIFCRPLLLPPPIPPSIRVFSEYPFSPPQSSLEVLLTIKGQLYCRMTFSRGLIKVTYLWQDHGRSAAMLFLLQLLTWCMILICTTLMPFTLITRWCLPCFSTIKFLVLSLLLMCFMKK